MPGSPLAPVTSIEPERWRYFKITDRKLAIAEGPNGEKLYCVRVRPSVLKASVSSVPCKASSVAACTKWLIQRVQASPEKPTAGKKRLYEEARRLWPDLSCRSFTNRCWPDAVRAAGAPAWSQAGRCSQSHRS